MKVTAPKVTPPRLVMKRYSGAFNIDADTISAIDRTFTGLVGVPTSRAFILSTKNGSAFEVDSIDQLDLLPFNDTRSRDKFDIRLENYSNNERQYINLTFIFEHPARVTSSAGSVASAQQIADLISAIVESSRTWYSWIYSAKINWFLVPIIWLMLFLTFSISKQNAESQYFVFGIWAACLMLVLGVYFGRRWLFDPVVFEFGPEKSRQAMLVRARKYVFGTCLSGLALTIIAAAVKVWVF